MKRRRAEAEPMRATVVRCCEAAPSPPLPALVDACLDNDTPRAVLRHLFSPLPLRRLFRGHWGEHALALLRSSPTHFAGLCSADEVFALLSRRRLRHGLHVDVTRWSEAGGRETLDGGGERLADAASVRARVAAGCSVRILHPQRWIDPLHALCGCLERVFHTAVGCNLYLTPAGAQGFAPHYDDIEARLFAIVLQLEGTKTWRLYAPRRRVDVRPRTSSPNFTHAQLGALLTEVTLLPGDTLYLPRGCVHEAATPGAVDGSGGGVASLHATLSCSQSTTWADLIEAALPAALAAAARAQPCLRQALPLRYGAHLGVMHSGSERRRRRGGRGDGGDGGANDGCEDDGRAPDVVRRRLLRHARRLLVAVAKRAPIDAAADQMAASFQAARSQPVRNNASSDNASCRRRRLRTTDRVRPSFVGAATLLVEGRCAVVAHPFCNERGDAASGEGGGGRRAFLRFPLDDAPAIEALLSARPGREAVAGGAGGGDEGRCLGVAQQLMDAGILVAA